MGSSHAPLAGGHNVTRNIPAGNVWRNEDLRALLYSFADGSEGIGPRELVNPRIELCWIAGRRGKPSLNAVLATDETSNAAAHLAKNIADPHFEVLGTNMTTALSTYNAEGGITLTTAGADNDQAILLPHLDAGQSPWTQITWGTDREVAWQIRFDTGSSIAAMILWAGLKLTNTPTIATDNEQVFFRYQNAVNSGKFEAIYSIGGTDVTVDSGVTVAASTAYELVIAISAARIARMFINGALVATSTALAAAADLIPYLGVQASGAAAAKAVTVHGQSISRARRAA